MELLLRDFIKAFRSPTNQFYMHTDEHALHRAHEKLAEKSVDDGVGLDELASDTFVPPAAAKYVLLSALSDMSIGVGCGHIKNMVPCPCPAHAAQSHPSRPDSLSPPHHARWADLHMDERADRQTV